MKKLLLLICCAVLFSSCSVTNKTMKNPDSNIEFRKSDFTISGQASASHSSTRILGIDWENLFKNKKGAEIDNQVSSQTPVPTTAMIPIIGGNDMPSIGFLENIFGIFFDQTEQIATHNLITKNSDADVVLYPRYKVTTSKPILGIGFIYKKTQVTVTARMGQLNQ